MRSKAIDLTGRTFGRLRVLRRDGTHRTPEGGYIAKWPCLCDPELGGCGNRKSILGVNLKNGHTVSCGCFAREYQKSRGKNGNGLPGAAAPTKERA